MPSNVRAVFRRIDGGRKNLSDSRRNRLGGRKYRPLVVNSGTDYELNTYISIIEWPLVLFIRVCTRINCNQLTRQQPQQHIYPPPSPGNIRDNLPQPQLLYPHAHARQRWHLHSWLFNPILYMINAFRYGILGVSDIDIRFAFLIIADQACG